MVTVKHSVTETFNIGVAKISTDYTELRSTKTNKIKKLYLLIIVLILPVIPYFIILDLYKNPTSVFQPWFKLTERRQFKIFEAGTSMGLQNEERKCHLPKLHAFDASILKFVTKPNWFPNHPCTVEFPLLFELDLNSNIIRLGNLTAHNVTSCCYKLITRANNSDKEIKYSKKCYPILNRETKISSNHEFLSIYCKNITTNKTDVVDMFAAFHLKPDVENRITEINENINTEQVNIVILGIDGVSHMNFIRTNPKTYEFLTKNLSAIGMDGYTKVGSNTFPNLLAALMGLNESEVMKSCYKPKGFLDTCPFIWKKFQAKGYRTFYAEDDPKISAFNFGKKGFKNPPTDYYPRPLNFAQKKTIATHNLANVKLCYGPRLAFNIGLDYSRKLAYTMGKNRRYFQFLWLNTLSHDYLNAPMWGDKTLLSTLEWFKEEEFLNNTVFVLMSDHGIRWGGIRSTYQGGIEARMPFLYFVFPTWFSEKYRSAVSNLRRNRDRLTSPFDFYETLKDLSALNIISSGTIKERHQSLLSAISSPETYPRRISLFLPIPLNRDCSQAGIPEHFCVCHVMKSVSVENNVLIGSLAKIVVTYINNLLTDFPQCSKVTLWKVVSAQVLASSNKNITKIFSSSRDSSTFVINLITTPGQGNYEATVTKNKNGFWGVTGDISRTSLYGNQSHCVFDYNTKKYCYCLK